MADYDKERIKPQGRMEKGIKRMRKKTAAFADVYGDQTKNRERYDILKSRFSEKFGQEEQADGERMSFYSSPGRTEIIGNHTDHNGGKILAGSIDLDTIGVARKNDLGVIRIESEGYAGITLAVDQAEQIEERTGTMALLAGIVAGFHAYGFRTGGFDACVSTTVIPAAGVSSSASYEMLICAILNDLYNDGQMDYPDYARIGQYAENHFWNKASGQMDQMACACGGTILLDFSDPGQVRWEPVDFSFGHIGYDIVIVNTGKGHADLSEPYSLIPKEMRQVAGFFHKDRLIDVDKNELLGQLDKLSSTIENDRAILRALHFLNEDERVSRAAQLLKAGKAKKILPLLDASGRSSFDCLQNCYIGDKPAEQKIPLALALTEMFLEQIQDGVCRVHGGGFAGVIMTVVPSVRTQDYVQWMAPHFGRENIYPMNIRPVGAVRVEL